MHLNFDYEKNSCGVLFLIRKKQRTFETSQSILSDSVWDIYRAHVQLYLKFMKYTLFRFIFKDKRSIVRMHRLTSKCLDERLKLCSTKGCYRHKNKWYSKTCYWIMHSCILINVWLFLTSFHKNLQAHWSFSHNYITAYKVIVIHKSSFDATTSSISIYFDRKYYLF